MTTETHPRGTPSAPPEGARSEAALRLEELARAVLDHMLESNPVRATMLGDHSGDDLLPDPSEEAHQEDLAAMERQRRDLEALDPAGLDVDQAVDREVLLATLGEWIFEAREVASHRWNPLGPLGTVGGGLNALVSKTFAPLSERLDSFTARLAKVPGYLREAGAGLAGCPRPHVEVALQQAEGLRGLLHVWDREAGDDRTHAAVVAAAEVAVREFAERLRTHHLPVAGEESWRLGRERFSEKVQRELDITMSAGELREAAAREAVRAHRGMLAAARRLLGRSAEGGTRDDAPLTEGERAEVLEGLDLVCGDHATPEGLVDACRSAVEEVRAWSDASGLFGPRPDDRLRVELWPEFSRGVAVACLDPPGPFDGEQVESYFYICPIPAEWSAERSESFLREYNHSQLCVLASHEAYPGHFVQQSLARRHPSVVRSACSSGTFVEGWAVYVEELLMEHGFRDHDPAYAMAFWKMRLRSALNAWLDHAMHTGEKSPAECLETLLQHGFQERGEAEGKVLRSKLTSAQLSTYFAGVHEVLGLRDRHRAGAGSGWSPAAFHQALLSHGSVAPRHLARLLGLPTR